MLSFQSTTLLKASVYFVRESRSFYQQRSPAASHSVDEHLRSAFMHSFAILRATAIDIFARFLHRPGRPNIAEASAERLNWLAINL